MNSLTVSRVRKEADRAMREIREECANTHVPTPQGYDWVGRILRRIDAFVLVERSGFTEEELAVWNKLTTNERRELLGMLQNWSDVR